MYSLTHIAISPAVVTHTRKDVRKERICKKLAAYKTAACIDIHCEIQAVPFAQLSQMQPGEPSATIRERVIRARNIQTERFSSLPKQGGQGRVHCNAMMSEKMLHEFAEPDDASMEMLRMAMERLKLSEKMGTVLMIHFL